jgi:hypothetical protein
MVQAGMVLTVHGAQAFQYPPTDAKSLQHLPQHVPWYCIKGLFEVHKTSVWLFFSEIWFVETVSAQLWLWRSDLHWPFHCFSLTSLWTQL